MASREDTFSSWAQPPGQTEQDKCDNAERAIRKAISGSGILTTRTVSVFAQGSYRNRTNVRADSDVDICICCSDSMFFDLPDGMQAADFGIGVPADYPYGTFKSDVHAALVDHFGAAAVRRGNKAFDIHENTYRIAADAVPCFEYRRYRSDGTYLTGTGFLPDSGNRIVNWPEQNYQSGVGKNDSTGRRFKGVVRILKHLRNEMADAGMAAVQAMSSYLIESLVWNVPNPGFGHPTWSDDVRYALAHLFNETRTDDTCREWDEINELKYLFRSSQPWTREAANRFLDEAWNYIGFE